MCRTKHGEVQVPQNARCNSDVFRDPFAAMSNFIIRGLHRYGSLEQAGSSVAQFRPAVLERYP